MAELQTLNKRLAKTPAATVQRNQYLAFTLGNETFAMDIRLIKEIIQYGDITEVPLMPEFVRGVINLRGSVVPVLDLSLRFGKACTDITRHTCIVILEVQHGDDIVVLGAIVDQVNEVMEIGSSDIEPAPAFGSNLRSDFISGVGKVGGKFVILLDVNHVLSIDELATLSAGSEGAAP